MPIVKNIKKVGEVAGAVVSGYKDYAGKVKQANADAERNLQPSFGNSGQANDVSRVAKETARIKKERNISLKNSVRSKLGL